MRARAWAWMLGVVPLMAACEETATPPIDVAHDHPFVDASPDVHAAHDAQHDVDDAAVDASAVGDVAPDVTDVPTPCTPLRTRALSDASASYIGSRYVESHARAPRGLFSAPNVPRYASSAGSCHPDSALKKNIS